MDAPLLSPEHSRELAALRRRAYGPAADIAADAAAVGRLRELEALARGTSTPPDEASPLMEAGPVPTTPDAAPPAPAESSRPWWRRIPVWAVAGAGVVVGIAIGAAVVSFTAPQPDRTLRVSAAADRGPDWERDLRSWGLDAVSAVPYGAYDGVGVWLVRGDDGGACVLLADNGAPFTASCARGGLDPILDVTIHPGMEAFFDGAWPTGSMVRFVGRGDTIDVWERRAQDSAGPDTSWSDSVPRVP